MVGTQGSLNFSEEGTDLEAITRQNRRQKFCLRGKFHPGGMNDCNSWVIETLDVIYCDFKRNKSVKNDT